MTNSNRLIRVVAFSIATAALIAGPGAIPNAHAQQDEQESESLALDEIVVTSRKREERLLEVPLTITVLTAVDLELKAIDELDDIVDFTPGFHYGGPSVGSAARSNRRLIMRGMQVSTDVQTRQSAMMFIDGTPVLGSEVGSLEGVERVEIVKGPASAYFGRATFGGAINFITKNPGMDKWTGKVKAEAGSFGTSDVGLLFDGPLVQDKLGMALSASSYNTDGQWVNAGNSSETFGRRSTDDYQLTLYATPNERFSAKVRLHYWEDDDGPAASVGYGLHNGEDVFNCNLGGTGPNAGPVNGTNNYVCGTPRFPTKSEIGYDTVVTPEIQLRLDNQGPNQLHLLDAGSLKGYGLYREAYETSLALDYTFGNGMSISSITANHQNQHRNLDDFDRRVTGDPAVFTLANNLIIFGDSRRESFDQEFRLTSGGDQKLRWLAGLSYSEVESTGGGQSRFFGAWSANANGFGFNKVKTTGVFGSVAYDIGQQFTLNVEGRYQKDEVTDGSEFGSTLSGNFYSFTPRIILDYKPTEDMTIYAQWAQGTRPGEFNSALVGLPPSVLECIEANIGADITIPEENLDNFELGFKGALWDGRATLTAAVYSAEWRDIHSRGLVPCEFPDGSVQITATTGTGGSTDMWGFEMEFKFAATENLTLEANFAINDTKFLVRDCADCLSILGFRDITGLGKESRSTPRESGSASGTYRGTLRNGYEWFARLDYLYRGSEWATHANITETGTRNKVNLRIGVENETGLRLEAYATNIFDDKAFTGYQRLNDFAFFGAQFLTAGLPEKPTYGVRATYSFDFNQ